jgi:hypothetical protein
VRFDVWDAARVGAAAAVAPSRRCLAGRCLGCVVAIDGLSL